MVDSEWDTIKEFPEPSPKEPGIFKAEILFHTTLITVIIAMITITAVEPASKATDQYIFEEFPKCQVSTTNQAEFQLRNSTYCIQEVEFCYNQTRCSLKKTETDRFTEYQAKLPDVVSNQTFYYRLRPDVNQELFFNQFACWRVPECESA